MIVWEGPKSVLDDLVVQRAKTKDYEQAVAVCEALDAVIRRYADEDMPAVGFALAVMLGERSPAAALQRWKDASSS